jgi:hypothetical protein
MPWFPDLLHPAESYTPEALAGKLPPLGVRSPVQHRRQIGGVMTTNAATWIRVMRTISVARLPLTRLSPLAWRNPRSR